MEAQVAEDIDERAIEEWQEQKSKKRKRGRPSNGSAVKRLKRTRAIRKVSDRSSEIGERLEDGETSTGSVLNESILNEEATSEAPPSSSIEIPETQQEAAQLPEISVDIPRTTLNLEDYESLHSSQLKDLSSPIQESSSPIQSSTKSTNEFSRPTANDVYPNKKVNGVISIGSSSQKATSSDDIIRPLPARLRSRLSKAATTLPQPLTRDVPSSPISTGPDFVPNTLHTLDGRLREQPSALQPSLQDPYSESSSSWGIQTQLPSQPPITDSIVDPEDITTSSKHLRSRGSPTHSQSDRSYHSAEQTPGDNSPLFCSPDPSRPKTASSNSSFGDDFVLDSIESDTQPTRDDMDLDSIASSSEPALAPAIAPQATIYDVALGGSALPIQNSIEEEEPSSNGEPSSSDSKGSSSQQSLDNERDLPQISGLVQPSLPILGPNEFVLALPCEGKIQSTYADIIKAKEKSIKKFLSRHESIGSANGSPNRTHERNEMNEMIQRLHDTVTHMDLGLPGFSTQYSINSQEQAAYANYAGSKFLFLGYLVEPLRHVGISIVIMSREGQVQDLIEQYLKMKDVVVKRQDRMARSKSPTPGPVGTDFQVELVSTWSTYQVDLRSKPVMMIAFDASFDAQDPQVARIRAQFERRHRHMLMPVLHFLTLNSSEHVDRCLPKSLPSPVRLKALVRSTYSALPNLGGVLRYLKHDSDVPEGRPMDLSDYQKGLRKTPERKLVNIADKIKDAILAPEFGSVYNLMIPPLELNEFDETPSMKPSRTTTRPETPRDTARSRTPVSRAGTPSGRKRFLDVDGVLPALTKRQRLTPLRDSIEVSNFTSEPSQLAQLQEQVKKLQADLATEKEARQAAEQEQDSVKGQLTEWQRDHAGLQRRYEKRMTKCHELDREKTRLQKTIENNETRHERTIEDNTALRQKNAEHQKELTAIREEIIAGGGDAAQLELAREAARTALTKSTLLEKSLENTRKDFEFTRTQYQNASTRATELAGQVTELEAENSDLNKLASDEKRRLRSMNHEEATQRHLAKIEQLELERKPRDALLKRLEEENRQLKRNRTGVQTRGSSVQPPASPGMEATHIGRGTRSRHSSPAPNLVPPAHRVAVVGGSSLRNEQ